MRRIIVFLLLFILGVSVHAAVEIVYPKSCSVTINSGQTFFIGNSDRDFTINEQVVPRNRKGAFAHVVFLQEGENIFIINNKKEKQIYKIIRPAIDNSLHSDVKQIDFEDYQVVMTSSENVPLRSTPVNAGINRLSNLPFGVILNVIGEKGSFYKILLDNQQLAWIAKNNVVKINTDPTAKLKRYEYFENKDYYTFVFHLDKKVPFVIDEGATMTLKLYNIEGSMTYKMDFPYAAITNTEQLWGYSGEFVGNDFIWKIRKPLKISTDKPLKNIKIALDAGHGGCECGAISCFGDKEKDINLIISKYLQQELKKRGAHVVMTRSEDVQVGLQERVDFANDMEAVILLSIHCNALPDNLNPNENKGTSIYYYYDMAKPLASYVMREMTEQLGLNNDRIRQGSLALVRNTSALSLLIEVGYLINPDDSILLREDDFQRAVAKAIADGLEKFLGAQ